MSGDTCIGLRYACAVGVIATCSSAHATVIGDSIAFSSPSFVSSPLFDVFGGAGYPLEPFLGPPATPDMVVDITTGTFLSGTFYGITYAFGVPVGGVPSPIAPPTEIVTHDLEWVGVPSIPALDVYFYATPGTAMAAFGGGFAIPTTFDLDITGVGFDTGIGIVAPGTLLSGDAYLILFGDPHLGTGTGPPPIIPGMVFMGSTFIPAPGAATLAMCAGLLAFRRARREVPQRGA